MRKNTKNIELFPIVVNISTTSKAPICKGFARLGSILPARADSQATSILLSAYWVQGQAPCQCSPGRSNPVRTASGRTFQGSSRAFCSVK